jgi:hypothetical protein
MYVPRGAFATLSGQPLEILPKGNEAAAVTVLSTLNMPRQRRAFALPLKTTGGVNACADLYARYLANALGERWESEKGQSSSPSIDLT